MKVYATSDQHFFHKNIIEYANRPFQKTNEGIVETMKTILFNYNEIVNDEDIVYWVGDIAMCKPFQKESLKKYLKCFKGRKILIRGNHDKESYAFYKEFFEEIHDFLILNNNLICHYPMTISEYSRKTELNVIKKAESYILKNKINVKNIIHGHTHQKNANYYAKDNIPRINVCVDYPSNYYKPIDITHLF